MKLTKAMLTEMVKEVMKEQMEEAEWHAPGYAPKSERTLRAGVEARLWVEWDPIFKRVDYYVEFAEPRLVKKSNIEWPKEDSSSGGPKKSVVLQSLSSMFNKLEQLYRNQEK